MQQGRQYVDKELRFALFFRKQRHFRWSRFGFFTHTNVASPGQICKWGRRNCWKASGNGPHNDIQLTLLPSVRLSSKNMSTAVSGAASEAPRFCCAHFHRMSISQNEFICDIHRPGNQPPEHAGPCNRLFSARCVLVSRS